MENIYMWVNIEKEGGRECEWGKKVIKKVIKSETQWTPKKDQMKWSHSIWHVRHPTHTHRQTDAQHTQTHRGSLVHKWHQWASLPSPSPSPICLFAFLIFSVTDDDDPETAQGWRTETAERHENKRRWCVVLVTGHVMVGKKRYN